MKLQQLHKHFLYLIGNKWMRMGMFFFLLKQLTIQTFYLMSPHLQCNNISQLKFRQEIYFSLFMILYTNRLFQPPQKLSFENRKIVNKTKNKQKTKTKTKK